MGAPTTAAVLVPVKAFAKAKQRLADALSPADRVELARAMAATVLGSGIGTRLPFGTSPIWVIV